MNIENLTISDARNIMAQAEEVRKAFGVGSPATAASGRWVVGKNYFIRTVTHHLMGKLEEVTPHELWLSSVSWIADDGRFNEFLRDGVAHEVEPAPDGVVAVGRGSLIDAYEWKHELLRSVK